MDRDFLFVDGMFKTNTDLVKKTTDVIRPEHWFLKPDDASKPSDVGGGTSGRQSRVRA